MVATSNHPLQRAPKKLANDHAVWSLSRIGSPDSSIVLAPGRWSVGSETQNRLTLENASVAAMHCLLIANEDQLILRSWQEPTLVNGDQVGEAILSSRRRIDHRRRAVSRGRVWQQILAALSFCGIWSWPDGVPLVAVFQRGQSSDGLGVGQVPATASAF